MTYEKPNIRIIDDPHFVAQLLTLRDEMEKATAAVRFYFCARKHFKEVPNVDDR